jgi:predicted HTH transcriptional regulator
MTLWELKKLVAKGEGQQLEFKRKADYPHKIVKEVVAFANSNGGKLILGVDDDLSIPGLKNPEEERYVMENAIKKLITPEISYQLIKVPVSDKRAVYIFDIPEGEHKPYFVNRTVDLGEKKAFVRVKDQSLQASFEMKQLLKLSHRKDGIRFNYGEKEQKLMKYLGEKGQITLPEYAATAQIPKWLASRSLVLLCAAGVLQIVPGEQYDVFIAKIEGENPSIHTQSQYNTR